MNKKITLILAFIGMISLQGCSVNETPQNIDYDTISEVFEYSNVDFLPNSYSATLNFPHTIYSSDMVLVYRLSGVFQGEDVWKLQPETYYFGDGTLDFEYNFDFTRYDVNVYMNGYGLFGDVKEKFITLWHNERTSKYLFSFNYIPSNFEGMLIGSSVSDNLNTKKISKFKVYNASINGGNASTCLRASCWWILWRKSLRWLGKPSRAAKYGCKNASSPVRANPR